jgi:CMP-N,N'-diacetyllegionaminic acid synthase
LINNKRVLAVIPARGGSKGIKDKNLKSFMGMPLVCHALQCALSISVIDRIIVSTDSLEIAQAAKDMGVDVPFMRPPELSGDRVPDQPVLSHAVLSAELFWNETYEYVLMLQPTSPMRTPDQVNSILRFLVDSDVDAVWSVSITDSKSHPLKQLDLDPDTDDLQLYHPDGADVVARQQLSTLYHRNGVAYAFTRSAVLVEKTVMPKKTKGFVTLGPQISIDTLLDFELAEFYFEKVLRS